MADIGVKSQARHFAGLGRSAALRLTPEITLRTRLVMLVVAAIVPLFGLSVVRALLNAEAAISQATRNLEFSASLVASNQRRVADSARQTLTAISNIPGMAEGKKPDCQRYFKNLVQELSVYANLGIVGPDGVIRCHSAGGAPGFAGDRPYFQAAVARRGFVSDGYIIGRVSGKPIITFAQPVLGPDGRVVAVAFAAMLLSEVAKEVNIAQLPKESQLLVIDRRGIVLAANPATAAEVGRPSPSTSLQAAMDAGSEGIFEGPDSAGKRRIYALVSTGNPANLSSFVAVSAIRSEVLAPARFQLLLESLVLTLVAFFGGWIAWLIGGSAIVRPTARILEATGRIAEGRLDVRIPPGPDGPSTEFTRIADGINSMADALAQREHDLAQQLQGSRQANADLAQLQASQAKSYAELRTMQGNLVEAQRLGRIGHWEVDVKTGQMHWSDQLQELFGLAPGTFDGRHDSFLGMLHPEDRAHYVEQRAQAHRTNCELDIEYRIVTPSGAVRWMHQRGRTSNHADAGGMVTRTGVVQDITERKQSELALTHSTELLRRTGELARIGGWTVTLEPLSAEWSEELYRIHELEIGTPLDPLDAVRFYAPEVQSAFKQAVREAIHEAIAWDMELPFVTAKGRKIWVRTQGQPVLRDGKVTGLAGALQDITGQHESREHLRLLETSISRLNDMVLITDAESVGEDGPRIVYVNDAFERHTGFSREEVLGQSPRLLQGPKTQPEELARIGAALKAWQPVRSELINYTKSGTPFWVELDIVPITDAKGRHTHWVGVQRDVTARRLAKQALVESEQRYAALFESAPVPMWIVDSESQRFLAVNGATVKRYGYSREEFLGMTLFNIRSDIEARRLRAEIVSMSRRDVNRRVHRTRDGTEFHVETVSRVVQYDGRPARFVVALDMTAQVKAEMEVQEQLFMLQRGADAAQAITWHQTLEGMLNEVAGQARGVVGAHQAVVSLTDGNNWARGIVALSLSEKYAAYRDLAQPPSGEGIYAMVCEGSRVVRMTQAELEAHPRWRGFGDYADKHPPMRGWLAVPLMGRAGQIIGLLQLSDKYEGDFTIQDEYVAIELAQLAAIAIENAQLLEQVNQLNTGLEQKVTERTVALARQEALFRALAEQAPQVVWTVDPTGAATYFNRAWFELVGGELEQWTGRQWFDAIHPEDLPAVHKNWKAATAGTAPFVGIRRLLDKYGNY
ncbi:MAG: multi-sensor signal transduction histidine kinase, partial [Polaromonas sp.]|nr:multi-sensor signal transduction histidine kinase [Polaromonas sp.]